MRIAFRLLFSALALLAAAGGLASSVRLYCAAAASQRAATLLEKATAPGSGLSPASRLEESAAAAQRSISCFSGDPAPLFTLAQIASREARHSEAADQYLRSLELDPFDSTGHYYLGRALGETGRREEAKKAFAIAVELGRNRPQLIYWAGYYHWSLFRKVGRFEDLSQSFEYFRKSAELDLGYLEKSLKTIEGFSLHYDNVVQLIPDTPEAHYKGARYLGFSRGLWTPALAEFEKAGAALESNPNFLFDRGLAKLFTGRDPFPDLKGALAGCRTRQAWIRKLPFYFKAAGKSRDSLPFWDDLAKEHPDLTAPAINRVEAEIELVREGMQDFLRESFEKMKAAVKAAGTPEEKKAAEQFHYDLIEAEWGKRLAGTEAFLREKIEKNRDGELLGLLGDVLDAQDRADEAQAAMGSAAETLNVPGAWKKYYEFLMRRSRFEDAWKAALEAKKRFPEDASFEKLAKVAQGRMLGEKPR